MKRSPYLWSWCFGLLAAIAAFGIVSPLSGQSDAPLAAAPAGEGGDRPLAPGVMKKVEPRAEVAESVSRHDVVELLAVDPSLDFAKDVAFRRDIWYLEFQFKPVRMVWVDTPQPSGQLRRQLIWYMVYSVTNPGKALHPTEDNDGTYTIVPLDKPIRFIPQFLLESAEVNKAYPDRVIPAAMAQIRTREQRGRNFTLYN